MQARLSLREGLFCFLLVVMWGPGSSGFRAQTPAFPGAEGFGARSSGGRGGAAIAVTNLRDNGPGSLRAAIESSGPRTIIFRISGTIDLQAPLRIRNGDLTVAGQTAPGEGICLRNYPLLIEADNIIIRFVRIRLGDRHRQEEDAISGYFHRDIIIDHCSFSWGIDEVATIRDNVNSTVQWCIISESLHRSYHHKGEHGYGGIWGGMGASFHHNLLAHHASRNPRFHGSRYHHQPEKELVDFRNNAIYNWGFNSSYGGEGGAHNLIANYYKAGPASQHPARIVEPWDATGKWYIDGNIVHGFPEISADNWAGGIQGKYRDSVEVAARPFPVAAVETQSAGDALRLVLAKAGAIYPVRDAVDRRVVEEVLAGTATFGDSWGAGSGIIDSQESVGGWPELHGSAPPTDSDGDGIPDAWEKLHQLNPNDPGDGRQDRDGDGYTALEDYLNSLVKM